MPIIFQGDENTAYRDPTCYFNNGEYHLFFTVSEKEDGYMYNYVAHSVSRDLKIFSALEIITEKDRSKNFCSPGNVILKDGEFYIFVTSYPMPLPYSERYWADENARLFYIKTADFKTFSEPIRLYPKGKDCENEGRMIDPFVLDENGKYLLFFKQNGISLSVSSDLEDWEYLGRTDGGENACVLKKDGKYLLIHSPENGIGIMESSDLKAWHDLGIYTLDQQSWEWASGRLTAAFAMETELDENHKYAVFFHGSRKDPFPKLTVLPHLRFATPMISKNSISEFKKRLFSRFFIDLPGVISVRSRICS